ncbi:MAG TPA: tetratricopeptide repeat protein [Anaerolineae bacterium]|nr:tetratricopeptide repeat protein [Anaerolineae bacterium]HQI86585.1 tetratricopeptide repeat protein [Anaerolineae bacterium]
MTTYLFKHILIRDTVYTMQLRTRLRELHARAGEAIESLHADNLAPFYADLAYHYGQADIPDKERYYALQAGRRAADEYANEEALRFLTRAMELTPSHDKATQYEILSAREMVYDLQGNREAQRHDLQLLFFVAQGEQKADVVLRQARYEEQVGNYTGAVDTVQRCVELAQRYHKPATEARAYLYWARAEWRQGRYHAAMPLFEQALSLARQVGLPDTEADSLRNLGNVHWSLGQYPEAMAYYEQALSQYQTLNYRRGESATLNNISIVLVDQGDYAQARAYSESALHLKTMIGDRIGARIAHSTLGDIAWHFGQLAEARQHYEAARRLSEEVDDPPGRCEDQVNLARLAYREGNYAVARTHSQQALALARGLNDANIQAFALLFLGHAALEMGDYAEAATAYTDALALRRALRQEHLIAEPLAGLAHVWRCQGELAQARTCLEELLSYLPEDAVQSRRILQGARDPTQIYLTAYRVLQALDDPRAGAVLLQGYAHLQACAARISDAALRRQFLEDVTPHRLLAEEARLRSFENSRREHSSQR